MFLFHHIGLACENLETEIIAHEMLGYQKETDIFFDHIQNVKGIFLVNNGFRVELLQPLNDKSPLNNYLKRKIKMYHQCFTCEDIYSAIKFLEDRGAILVTPPVEAIAFSNRNIAFLFSKTQMLIELVQK